MSNCRDTILLASAAVLSIGFVVGVVIFSNTQKQLRLFDRTVTVKGLVEKNVVADIALWSLDITVGSENLIDAQSKMEKNIRTVKKFLTEKGFHENEITDSSIHVTDRQAAQYSTQKAGQLRYVIKASVRLRSKNIELVQKVSRMTNELVKAGITLSGNTCSGTKFIFTKLNDVKPEMLVEATKNARESGDQFANDSGSTLGKIKRAYQGVFSINERDDMGSNRYNGCNSSPNKKIRVVTTVTYYLE